MGATPKSQTEGGPPRLSPEQSEGEADPSRDELFHVLRNHRRRFAIHHLKRESDSVDVGELATQVAAWENGVAAEEVTSKQRRRVYNSLQQTHIPELDDTGIVEVDRREVRLTDLSEELDIYLEVVPGNDVAWSTYYLALGAVGLSALVVTGLNLGPFGTVPDIAAGTFLAITLVVSACANYYYQNQNLVGGAEKPPEVQEE